MKTRFFVLVGSVLVALALTMSAAAQEAAPACSVADVLNTEYQGLVQRDWLQSVITTLNANIEDEDATNFLGTARELREILSRLDADCRGLHFTSDGEGMEPVIGPVVIPNGVWRVTFKTAGFGSVKTETIGGECKDNGGIFNAFEGDAADGAQQVFTSGVGCEVLIEVSNTSEDWDLMFEPIKLVE